MNTLISPASHPAAAAPTAVFPRSTAIPEFVRRFTGIISGTISAPDAELITPQYGEAEFECDGWKLRGTIRKRITRQLYSYQRELVNRAKSLTAHPDHPEERAWERSILYELSQSVDPHFWYRLYVEFPELERVRQDHIRLCRGWQVFCHEPHKAHTG